MREYRTSLNKRRYQSARIMERYWSDPQFRLECVNKDRARRGAPLLTCPTQIRSGWPKLPWAEKRNG